MATRKPYPAMPCGLGYIKPTSGTPLPVGNNYTDMVSSATNKVVMVHALSIRALAGNGDVVYVLMGSTAADTTNGLNIIDVIQPGGMWSSSAYGMNELDITKIYVDCGSSGTCTALPVIIEA